VRQSGCFPFWEAILELARLVAALAQQGDRFEREHAAGAAAVGDDLAVARQLVEPGTFQTVTGPLSDRWGRKGLIVTGMWVQAATQTFGWWLLGSILLGLGTAMVYPTLIAAVSDASHPSWRARSLSVYRFWRDLGYAIGALLAGIMADMFGIAVAIVAVGVLTFASGAIVALMMNESTRS
jgi:MFS family permease